MVGRGGEVKQVLDGLWWAFLGAVVGVVLFVVLYHMVMPLGKVFRVPLSIEQGGME